MVGLAHTIPEGMSPGSDTANLAVLGYNPRKYYTGRSPLEALSIGVDMKELDVALRCNIVTLSEDDVPYEEKTILDHSSGEISTEDAAVLIDAVRKELENDIYKFYVGTSYRHLTIWDKGSVVPLTPPHDILGKVIGDYLPKEEALYEMMKKSYEILRNHPVNLDRIRRGLRPANSAWFWSPGKKPALPSFGEKWGLKASVISAVDLIKGIALCAKMTSVDVEGATGNISTNFAGKGEAAINEFKRGQDYVYIHVEAPDECGHRAEADNKVLSIEKIDELILKPVYDYLCSTGESFKILILPDHPTPVCRRTHTMDAVPFVLYGSESEKNGIPCFCEENAQSGPYLPKGEMLMDMMING